MLNGHFSILGLFAIAVLSIVTGCSKPANMNDEITDASNDSPQWETIFNGKNLDGWVPKIEGRALGEDPLKTYRVEDGMLRVSYADYEKFGSSFGHLFFDRDLEHYKLRLEYRLHGTALEDAPDWAKMNSGLMLHAQSPESMGFDQAFPHSVEAQFLAVDEENPTTTTGNICTPGTIVNWGGQPNFNHCLSSEKVGSQLGEWVAFEAYIKEDKFLLLSVNGEPVMHVTNLLEEPFGDKTIESGTLNPINHGYLALQAESQPIDFRNIELLDLSK